MNKKITLGLALSLVMIASAVTFILTSFFTLQSFNEKVVDVNEKSKKYNSLNSVDAYVREHYYGDIDDKVLSNGTLKGLISSLGDPYSKYLTPEEYEAEQSSEEGSQTGLGLTLTEDSSGYIRITDILPDSPAAEEGLTSDDIIVRIDDKDIHSIGFSDAMNEMQGNEGSSIKLTIRRNGIDTDYTFKRRSIDIQSVSGKMTNGYIGYIQIAGFRKNTPDQFLDQLGSLTANGAKSLIIDLRDNEGGLITALEECADPLLPEGVIATAEYKDGHTDTIVYSDDNKLDIPVIVIVDKDTASTAELFAAALRDFCKAQIVGVKTRGNGTIQETEKMDDGGAIVLTVAECKTAVSEQSYNGTGIVPDVIVENNDAQNSDPQFDAAVELAMTSR